ncbi:hypothetical protein NLM33_07370 [Bradyrhizobium sp. CCGUVB1N3]|uniref:hypothetical protein n=1 Tax=Bradyrhizobium sp. CCGUVB1N3 TaxID=2949629 RepID=UPI0020B1C6AA|nr:hypothetical protein [Bradyrhizobium sp. CCGUVB1N3]MCP3470145.1 hypothetical protein [Bradyrhizobium sp. CCGUVB1N3]
MPTHSSRHAASFYGVVAAFEDPCGNRWDLTQRKSWNEKLAPLTADEDGHYCFAVAL